MSESWSPSPRQKRLLELLTLGGFVLALTGFNAHERLDQERDSVKFCQRMNATSGMRSCVGKELSRLTRYWPTTRTEARELATQLEHTQAQLRVRLAGRADLDAVQRDALAAELVAQIEPAKKSELVELLALSGALPAIHELALRSQGDYPLVHDYGVAAGVHAGDPEALTRLYALPHAATEHFVIDRVAGAGLCLLGLQDAGVKLLRTAQELSAPLALEACEGKVGRADIEGSWALTRRVAAHGGAQAWLDASAADDPARLPVLAQALLDEAAPATDEQLVRWLDAAPQTRPDLRALAAGQLSFLRPELRVYDPAAMLRAATLLAANAELATDEDLATKLEAGAAALAVDAGFESLVRGDLDPTVEAAELALSRSAPAARASALALLVHAAPGSQALTRGLAQGELQPELELRALVGRGEWSRAHTRATALREAATPETEAADALAKWEAALALRAGALDCNPDPKFISNWGKTSFDLAFARELCDPASGAQSRASAGHRTLDAARPDLDLVILGAAAPERTEVWLDAHFAPQFRDLGLALLWARASAARWRGDEESAARWSARLSSWRTLARDEDGWLLLSLAL